MRLAVWSCLVLCRAVLEGASGSVTSQAWAASSQGLEVPAAGPSTVPHSHTYTRTHSRHPQPHVPRATPYFCMITRADIGWACFLAAGFYRSCVPFLARSPTIDLDCCRCLLSCVAVITSVGQYYCYWCVCVWQAAD